MKIAIRIALLAALGGLAFWLWTVFFPSPERAVLNKVSQLAAAANISAGEGAISRAAKAATVTGAFAADAVVIIDAAGTGTQMLSGRDEIHDAAMGGFTQPALKTQFLDARARVGPDQQSAEVTCIARVSVDDSKDTGIEGLRFQLKKIDGDWKITRAETVKPLQ